MGYIHYHQPPANLDLQGFWVFQGSARGFFVIVGEHVYIFMGT